MFSADNELAGLLINSTINSTGGLPLRDECGYPRVLRFTTGQSSWIWITRISFPVFLVVGTFGNVLAVVNVCGDRKGPKRTFLLGMFVADLWFLWNRLIIQLGSRRWDIDPRGPDLYGSFYKMTAGIWLYLESVLFFASQWMLMAFCVDRFLAIRFPLHHRTNYRRNSFAAVTFIFMLSAVNALCIPVVYYWILNNNMLEPGAIIPQFPELFRQWRRIEMWWEVIERLGAYVGTAVLNTMIIARLRRTQIQVDRTPMQAPRRSIALILNHHSTVRRTNSNNAANKILIASSFFFLLTQSLDFGLVVLLASSQAPICLFHITNSFMQVYDPFQTFLVNMYFAFGFIFYLYCGENSSWRRIFVSPQKRLAFVDSLRLTESGYLYPADIVGGRPILTRPSFSTIM